MRGLQLCQQVGTLVPHFPDEETPSHTAREQLRQNFNPDWRLHPQALDHRPLTMHQGPMASRLAARSWELGTWGRAALSNRSLRSSWWVPATIQCQASGLGGGAKRKGMGLGSRWALLPARSACSPPSPHPAMPSLAAGLCSQSPKGEARG